MVSRLLSHRSKPSSLLNTSLTRIPRTTTPHALQCRTHRAPSLPQEHYDTAIYHFQQLLERSPNHYGALAQLILLLRRAGRLEDVPRYFALAEAGSPKATMEPGYHYCKGLYNR